MGAGNPPVAILASKENGKLKLFINPTAPFDNILFTLGETKDGVTTLVGEKGEAFVKLEGKFSVAEKKKKIEITYQEKGDGKKEEKKEAFQDVE